MPTPIRRAAGAARDLPTLDAAIADCFACPRLVAWREERPGQGRPVPRRDLLGAARAGLRRSSGAHPPHRARAGGARRQPHGTRVHRRRLGRLPVARDARGGPRGPAARPACRRRARTPRARIAAAVRCAPPANRPTIEEQATACRHTWCARSSCSVALRVIVALGAIGWDAALKALAALGHPTPRPKPRFAHGAEVGIGPYTLVGTYHPSQQNTFTGRLTPPMLEAVLERAIDVASA